ncbi:MAG: deoxyribonuclease IV [Anaerolineales bacterium]|nr:deoxyribonuclease IV [Anaerolineales bacterium]
MTTLRLGAHMSIAGGVSQALDRANQVHSNAVQVFTKNNRQWNGPPIDVADIRRWQEQMPQFGIEYAVSHASYLINLASPKDELWEKSQRAQQDELERAHAYGIAHVVLHPGAHMGSGEDAGIVRVASALNRIHDRTPDCADTITCLELMAGQGSTLGRSLEQLRAIIDQVDDAHRVGVCLDTCHAFAAGYELRTADGYTSFVADVNRILGPATVKVWHLNDSKGGLGSHLDRHTHIGEGEIGVAGFSHILNDPHWDGIAMLLETPKEETLEEDRLNLARLISLVDDPDRIPPGLR